MSARTSDDLLNALRLSMDEAYIEPLETEDDGAGFDVFRAIAAQLARTSDAVNRSTQAMYILPHSEQTDEPAAGGVQATGTLEITRAAPTDGNVVLLEGELLLVQLTSLDGEVVTEFEVEVSVDTTFTAGVSGPLSVPVRAVRVGYHANVEPSESRAVAFKQRTTKTITGATTTVANEITDSGSGDTFDDGDVEGWFRFTAGPNVGTGPRYIESFTEATDTVVVGGPALVAGVGNTDGEVVDLEELGFAAELTGAFSGGTSPMLDGLGYERNMGRGIGEADDEYRDRLKNLPDTISPNAIYRAASRILTPLGVNWLFLESRLRSHVRGFFADADPCDDPNASITNGGRLILGDFFDVMGFFIVVERTGDGEFGMLADQPAPHVGPRNAVDFAFADGFPVTFWTWMERLIVEIEKTRGSGVPWVIVLVDSIP